MLSIEFDLAKCDKCGKCVKICRNSKVIEANADGYPQYRNIHKCVHCGHCVAICPRNAIREKETGAENEHAYSTEPQMISELKIVPGQIQQLLAATRSNRFFIDKAVERPILASILDAMMRSPSAGNEQNRNFYIFPTRKHIIELEADMRKAQEAQSKLFANPILRGIYVSAMMKHAERVYMESGREFSKEKMKSAIEKDLADISRLPDDFYYKESTAAIMVTSDTRRSGIHKSFYKADVAIAVTHGAIMAAALGLASCRMGLSEILINKDRKLKSKYGISDHERVDGILALGYSDLRWRQIPIRGPSKVIWNQ